MEGRILTPSRPAAFKAVLNGFHRTAGRDMDVGTWALLAGGSLLLLGVRLLISLSRTGPVVIIDEIGYLTNARVLAGGLPGQMEAAPFYRGGYSLLIAPLVGLVDDPHTAYSLILVLNALLVSTLPVLLHLLLTRGFDVPARRAAWAALAAGAYPSVTLTSQGAMSENLLLPMTAAWLLALAGVLRAAGEARRAAYAMAAGTVAGASYAVHGRMVVVVGATAALLLLLLLRRRLSPLSGTAGLACMGVALAGARLLDDYLVEHNYGGRSFDEAGARLSVLGNVDDAVQVAGNVAGHTWYLLVATLGVAPLIVAIRGRAATRAVIRTDPDPRDLLMAVLLLTAAGLVVVSALSFPDLTRSDMLVYGRYTEVIAPSLLAVGLATLASGRVGAHPGRVVALILAVTAAVAVIRTTISVPGGEAVWSYPGLNGFMDRVYRVTVAEAGLGALAVTCLAAAASARLRANRFALLSLLVVTGGAALALRTSLVVPEGGNRWMVASMPFRTDNLVPWALVVAGLLGAAAAAAIVLSARRAPAFVAPLALLLFVPTTLYTQSFLSNHTDTVYPAGWASPHAAVERVGGEVVAYDMDHYDLVGEGVYQWYLPNKRVVLFSGGHEPPPASLVVSSVAWSKEHPDAHATEVWRDVGRDQVIWKLGG